MERTIWKDLLAELRTNRSDAGRADNGALQVLEGLLERVPEVGSTIPVVPDNPAKCPNCGSSSMSKRSPYCREKCRAEARFVRQFRASLAQGSIWDRDKQVSLGQDLWNLQRGGYPLRQLMVPAKVIAQVIARDGGLCTGCGAPASEIDHTGSG